METNFGTGAIPDKEDRRDFKYSVVGMANTPFDWSVGYDVEEILNKKITVKNQNGSSSCGGQAWGYYGQVLDPDKDEKSAKFIYAQTHVIGGGSGGRDNCKLVKEKGWGTELLTPSYCNNLPPSEEFMTKTSDITTEAFTQAKTDKAISYAVVNRNIDDLAQAIRDNKGCVIGIVGQNNGSWLSVFPLPPKTPLNNWRHWVYCGKAKMVDGKKYIGFLNSWGNSVGLEGWQWIGEEYINQDFIFDTYTLVYNYPLFKFTKTLKFGTINNEVKELQKRLGVIQTSFFGKLTQDAVKSYQTSKGLVPDGIVGILTRAKLNA